MKMIDISVEIISPVIVYPPTHISGSALRGALAAKYIQNHHIADPSQDYDFQNLFLNEQVIYSDLVPGGLVLPLTAMSCKRRPGFKEEGRHGVYDALFANITSTVPINCPECGQDLKRLEGYHDFNRVQKLETSVSTHVGIDRITSTAAPEILYSDAEIDEGQMLHGKIYAPEAYIPRLIELLEGDFYVGRSKTRGKGKVRVVSATVADWDLDTMRLSWEMWNHKAKIMLGKMWRWDFLFSVTLHSDVIIVDEFLRASNDLSDDVRWLPKAAMRECKFGDGTIEFVGRFCQLDRISGWNSAHKLPKNDDFCIRRGSVFIYGFTGNEADKLQLQDKLIEMSFNGIGLRRSEGFGRIVINDSFHSDYAGGDFSCTE